MKFITRREVAYAATAAAKIIVADADDSLGSVGRQFFGFCDPRGQANITIIISGFTTYVSANQIVFPFCVSIIATIRNFGWRGLYMHIDVGAGTI